MMKRTIALMLVLLVGLPWSVLPAGAGSACGPGDMGASASCKFCSSDDHAPTTESLRPGCCSLTPHSDATPIQATGVSPSPEPHQSPDVPATLADFASPGAYGFTRSDLSVPAIPPIHAPPTATTHLLI